MKKKLTISAGVVTGLILIVFIGVFAFLKPAVEYGLHRVGFQKARVDAADFSLSGTTLKNLRLDDTDNTVGEIKLYATLADAMAGHLSKVEIKDAKLQWPMELPASGNSGALDLRAKEVTLTNAALTIKTPAGSLPVTATGSIVDMGDQYKAVLDIKGEADFAKIDGKLTADLAKHSRVAKIDFKINEAKVTQPDFDVKRASGWIQVEIDPAKPLPLPTAQLDFGSLMVYGLPLQGASLKASTNKDLTEFLVTAEVPNDSGDIAVDFTIDRRDLAADKISLKAEAKLRKLGELKIANVKGEGNLMLNLAGTRSKSSDIYDMSQWKNLQGSAGIDMEKLSLPGLLSNAEALATVRLSLDPAARTVTAQAVDGAMSFSGTFRPIDLAPVSLNIPANAKAPPTIAWDEKGKTLRADFDGADFTGFNVMAKQVGAHLTTIFAAHPVLDGKLNIGELAHMTIAQQQFFLPVRLALQFQPQENADTVTGISGAVTEKNGKLTAKIKGSHDTAANKGELSLGMPPTALPPNVTSLATLFPISQKYLQDGYGIVGLSADFAWGKKDGKWVTDSRGQLYLKDFSCVIRGTALNGINTVMDLDSLSPLTLTKQQVAVGALNVGLPLTNGVTTISFEKGGSFTLHAASWTLAKGQVISSPFTMQLADMSTDVTLTASGMDLADLFKIAPMEGLDATGTVNGTLPLQIRNGEFSLVNGTLQTSGGGTIKYSPSKLPSFLANAKQQQLIDLKTALTNFDYDSLNMTMNGQLGQSQKVTLHVKGKNPLFYNGRPVDFNLNLEGPLENVLRYAPGGSTIPDSIKQQLHDYEASHAKL
ncbi:MAG: YdbH domain-containing protein [Alphaproteobacteria bacterium]